MPSDTAFDLFMATVGYEDLSSYERRLWRHVLKHPGQTYDPVLEDQLAGYARIKRGAK